MRRRVVTTSLADADITRAVDWYPETASTATAEEFIDELEDLQSYIADFPSIGSPRFAVVANIPQLLDMAMKRFPYIVFYSDDADAVRILRVLHTSRDIPAELT